MGAFCMDRDFENLPPLTWLRAFEAAARHLSFTNAARELSLTQSAISQHVRSLEAYLGQQLFVRKTRALELTESGGNYLPVIREAFALLASGTQAFTGSDRGQSMVLQCNMAFSVLWLAPRLHKLYQRHPWLKLNIVTPIWDPERHAADAAMEIRFGRPADMSPAAICLSRDRFYPVCSARFLGDGIDLESAPLFDCAGVTATWDSWFKSQQRPFERIADINLTSTFVIAIQAALHHTGLTMAHDTLVADLVTSGELVRPFEHGPELSEAYFLMPPAQHAMTPAAEAVIGFVREEMEAWRQRHGISLGSL